MIHNAMHAALEFRFTKCHHRGAKFNTTIKPLITITGMCVYAIVVFWRVQSGTEFQTEGSTRWPLHDYRRRSTRNKGRLNARRGAESGDLGLLLFPAPPDPAPRAAAGRVSWQLDLCTIPKFYEQCL